MLGDFVVTIVPCGEGEPVIRLKESISVPRRKKGEESSPPREDIAVKVDRAVIRYARSVASFRDITLAEYLSEVLRPIVTKDFDEMRRPKRDT